MGIVISNNIKLNQDLNCYKCDCCDTFSKNIQKEIYPINDNNINAQVTFEVTDKNNLLFSNQIEKTYSSPIRSADSSRKISPKIFI